MANQPLVTVIIPTYNRAPFLSKAIDSVLNQSYKTFELIVVDDGSTDETKSILDDYVKKDNRIRVFSQINQGQSVARNKALDEAKGDFICFLDSDNFWPKNKLKTQTNFLNENENVDVVYGDIITIDEDGSEVSRNNMKRYSGKIARWMLRDNCVSMNTAMAKRQCFNEMGGMSGTRRVADDYDLWLRFSAVYNFAYVPDFWAFYRVMKDQISSDKMARFESNELIINKFKLQFSDCLSKVEFDRGFSVFHIRKARYLTSVGKKRDAYRELFKALKYRPLDFVVWRGIAAVCLR
jgi:glycosyltransferase involved in cell wall biosynthesis